MNSEEIFRRDAVVGVGDGCQRKPLALLGADGVNRSALIQVIAMRGDATGAHEDFDFKFHFGCVVAWLLTFNTRRQPQSHSKDRKNPIPSKKPRVSRISAILGFIGSVVVEFPCDLRPGGGDDLVAVCFHPCLALGLGDDKPGLESETGFQGGREGLAPLFHGAVIQLASIQLP